MPSFLKHRKKSAGGQGKPLNLNKMKPTLANLRKVIANPEVMVDLMEDFLFNPNLAFYVMTALLPLELLLNIGIVLNIEYTEIDWTAYMQEVEGFINGTFNYYELKGDTGPLVYPAGFVYIYSFLYALTDRGTNIRLAQYVFIGIYLVFMVTVFSIYKNTKKVPPLAYVIMCLTSHRIHSIFVLRLFNDPIAMLLLYASILCIILKFWRVACIAFSTAVAIKMNVILFAPGLFIILLLSHGWMNTFKYIFLCAIVQIILGAPFLLTFPRAYLHMSFDLGRQFFYKWTVNWKCVPEEVFLNKGFQLTLLALHVVVLLAFLNKSLQNLGGLKGVLCYKKNIKLSPDFVIFTMFISNFVGICFSRSLHFQFYVWYYHTIAYLLWSTDYNNYIKLIIYGVIELCWNVYPATIYSSIGLNLCHLVMLKGIWTGLDSNNQFQLNKKDF